LARRGAILVISLWILAILAVIAAGLSHRAALELKRARSQADRLAAEFKCRSMVKIGIASVRDEKLVIPRDEVEVTDMGGMLNITFQGKLDKPLLEELFLGAGAAEDEAQDITEMIIDWTDTDNVIGQTEDEEPPFYKNEPFRDPAELLAVMEYYYVKRGASDPAGKASKLYDAISGSISVYPEEGVNINAADKAVLEMLCRAALKDANRPDLVGNISGLIDKILFQRKEEPFKSGVSADVSSVLSKNAGITAEEANILQSLSGCLEASSDHYRIRTSQRVGGSLKSVTAIYSSHADAVTGWHEN
jgi:hypothetical protein